MIAQLATLLSLAFSLYYSEIGGRERESTVSTEQSIDGKVEGTGDNYERRLLEKGRAGEETKHQKKDLHMESLFVVRLRHPISRRG